MQNASKALKNNNLSLSSASQNSFSSNPETKQKKPKNTGDFEVSPEIWVEKEGIKILNESAKKLGCSVADFGKKSLEYMDLTSLLSEKKKVKNELKFYDSSFHSIFKKMPSRSEKEPMRPLYIYYKRIKSQIDKREAGEKLEIAGSKVAVQNSKSLDSNKIRLEALKKEKNELKEVLHKYQVNFLQNYNRKIRYNKDIAPIEREYVRYKELKNEISRLESSIN